MPAIRPFPLLFLMFTSAWLFSQEGWMPGIGPTTAPAPSLIGMNARVYYGVNERFCFGPEFSIFPYQETSNDYETALWEANFNAHYVFELAHRFGTYPLAGLNYTNEDERLIANSNDVESHNAFGVNYGLGFHYNINRVLLFTEFKGVIGQLSDEFFTVGAVVLLKKPDNKQHSKD